MIEHILTKLAPAMIVAGFVLFGLLVLFAFRWPEICFALGFPAYIFLGQLKQFWPVSNSAGAAIFPIAAGAGFLLRGGRLHFGYCEKLMIGLGLLMALSLRYTPDPAYGRDKTILFFLLVLPVVVLAPNVVNSAKSLRLVMSVFFWTLAIYLFMSIVLHSQAEAIGGRAAALHDVTVAGQYLGLAVVAGFSYLAFGKIVAIGQYLLVCGLSLAVLLLFMTGTRGPILAVALSMLFVYWFVHVDGFNEILTRSRRTYAIVLLAGGIMFSGSLVLKNTLPEETYSRFASLGGFFSNFIPSEVRDWEDSRGRALNYMSAANAFLAHPLAGVGAGGYKTFLLEKGYRGINRARLLDESAHVYPHNVILEFACEQGILGLIVILWVIYLNFKMIWKLKEVYHSDPQRHFRLCPCATAYLFGLCVSMMSLDIPRMLILWWTMGLLLAANRVCGQQYSVLSKDQKAQKDNRYHFQGRHRSCLKSQS